MCVSPQRHAIFGHQNFKKWSETVSFLAFSLANMRFATAACNFWSEELQKVLRTWGVLYIFTCKCAFRQSGVHFFDIWTSKSVQAWGVLYIFTCKCAFRHSGEHFFDIWTSKSAPSMRCFVHLHLQMCVSPQQRAIFDQKNFKKCSENVVFCTFWLQNVRFATAACNFWFLCWARTSAPAALTGLLFDWPDTRIIEKTQHFATSLTFRADVSSFFWLSDYCIFCLLTWLLYCCAFHLLFNSPYCQKFLFKLPSINIFTCNYMKYYIIHHYSYMICLIVTYDYLTHVSWLSDHFPWALFSRSTHATSLRREWGTSIASCKGYPSSLDVKAWREECLGRPEIWWQV